MLMNQILLTSSCQSIPDVMLKIIYKCKSCCILCKSYDKKSKISFEPYLIYEYIILYKIRRISLVVYRSFSISSRLITL